MKVAYVFSSTTSQKILNSMIIPQLEADTHGAEVAGMFFFMDNTYFLLDGTAMGERLRQIQATARDLGVDRVPAESLPAPTAHRRAF
jgi:hypothetical protein